MWSFLPFGSNARQPRHPHRREERFATNLLSTDLGGVADISASGVRVHCTSKPGLEVGQVLPLTIRSPQCKVIVHSRVVRMERRRVAGRRGVDVSFAFLDATPALRAAITHLGQFGFIPRSGLDSPAATASYSSRGRQRRKPPPDYYGLLGLAPDASDDEIRKAYHRLARLHHPDIARNADSIGMFEALAEAYKTLRDPGSRRAYDAARIAAEIDAA